MRFPCALFSARVPTAAIRLFVGAAATFWCTAGAEAQQFPSRPLTIVVNFDAGGTTDAATRLYADVLGRNLGQRVIVENRPRGTGLAAVAAVQQAPRDGHTLLVANIGTHAILGALQHIPYNPVKDFQPVTELMSWNIYLAVRANLPVNSVAELVALARSRPEGLTYGSPGVGSGNHLLGELLKKKSGANLHHVPYRGGAGLSVDLLAGRIDMVFGSYREMHEFVRDGNVKLLAIAADARGTWKPELPTMGEAGFPGISMAPWFGVVVASGTPESTIAQLNAEFRKAAEDPDLRKRLAAQGIDAKVGAPDEFGRLIASEGAKWREVVKEAGLSTE